MNSRNGVVHIRPRALAEHAQALADASRDVWARGLTVGVCGNASIRIPGSDTVLIKGTGVSMGEMEARDAVLVSLLDGDVLDGDRQPSKELQWHLGIYRVRPDVGAIVHAHPPYATAWAVNNRVPHPVHVAARSLGPIALVEFAAPGSAQLAALVIEAFRPSSVGTAILRDHGVIAAGADVRAAFHLADQLEDAAKVAMLAGVVARFDEDWAIPASPAQVPASGRPRAPAPE